MNPIEVYAVGGYVRDQLMGNKSKDLDLIVTGLPNHDALLGYLEQEGYKVFQSRPEFLVCRALHPSMGPVDIALPRAEGSYSDSRRPDQVSITSLKDDLSRRDFTCNAIAQNLRSGEYVDPFGGGMDVANRILRTVGDPGDRFREDGLRILRAFRFALTKGFQMEYELRRWLESHYTSEVEGLLKGVSKERIYEEVLKMFQFDTLATLEMFDSFYAFKNHIFSVVPLVPTLKEMK